MTPGFLSYIRCTKWRHKDVWPIKPLLPRQARRGEWAEGGPMQILSNRFTMLLDKADVFCNTRALGARSDAAPLCVKALTQSIKREEAIRRSSLENKSLLINMAEN